VCQDRKQKARTQYSEQAATPCAVSDALHYFATARPFSVTSLFIWGNTFPDSKPWLENNDHSHPTRAEVYKVWRCIATTQYAMMLRPSSSSSGWGTDSSRHCLSILLIGPRKINKNNDPVPSSTYPKPIPAE
jgi:hypothetical protein